MRRRHGALTAALRGFLLFLGGALGGCGGGCILQPAGDTEVAASSRGALLVLPPEAEDLGVRGIRDEDVPLLARFPRVDTIDLSSGWKFHPQRITAKGFAAMAGLRLPKLRCLIIDHADNIDDEAVVAIASIPGLESLILRGCGPFGTAGIEAISRMPGLKWLDVRGCPGVTDDGVGALMSLRGMENGGLRLTATGLTPGGLDRIRSAVGAGKVDTNATLWEADGR